MSVKQIQGQSTVKPPNVTQSHSTRMGISIPNPSLADRVSSDRETGPRIPQAVAGSLSSKPIQPARVSSNPPQVHQRFDQIKTANYGSFSHQPRQLAVSNSPTAPLVSAKPARSWSQFSETPAWSRVAQPVKASPAQRGVTVYQSKDGGSSASQEQAVQGLDAILQRPELKSFIKHLKESYPEYTRVDPNNPDTFVIQLSYSLAHPYRVRINIKGNPAEIGKDVPASSEFARLHQMAQSLLHSSLPKAEMPVIPANSAPPSQPLRISQISPAPSMILEDPLNPQFQNQRAAHVESLLGPQRVVMEDGRSIPVPRKSEVDSLCWGASLCCETDSIMRKFYAMKIDRIANEFGAIEAITTARNHLERALRKAPSAEDNPFDTREELETRLKPINDLLKRVEKYKCCPCLYSTAKCISDLFPCSENIPNGCTNLKNCCVSFEEASCPGKVAYCVASPFICLGLCFCSCCCDESGYVGAGGDRSHAEYMRQQHNYSLRQQQYQQQRYAPLQQAQKAFVQRNLEYSRR